MYYCKFCGGNNATSNGRDRNGVRKLTCPDCGRYPSEYAPKYKKLDARRININAKILILDIETLPNIGYFWRPFKANIAMNQIIKAWCMLGWSAKWLLSSEVKSDFLTPEECLARDDGRICKSVWSLMDQADIIIAHNGNNFDLPSLNTRFLINNMLPPSSFRSIDTLKSARKHFQFVWNRLDYINQVMGYDGKDKMEFEDWVACDHGHLPALIKMETYCCRDVVGLEEVYLEMRPFIKPHPNVALFVDDNNECCHACGSLDIQLTGKFYYTNVSKFPTYRCPECGAETRSRFTALGKDQRKNLLTSTSF